MSLRVSPAGTGEVCREWSPEDTGLELDRAGGKIRAMVFLRFQGDPDAEPEAYADALTAGRESEDRSGVVSRFGTTAEATAADLLLLTERRLLNLDELAASVEWSGRYARARSPLSFRPTFRQSRRNTP